MFCQNSIDVLSTICDTELIRRYAMCDIKADEVLMNHLREHSVKCVICKTPMLAIFSHKTRYSCVDCTSTIESPLEILTKLKIIDR